MKEEKNKNKETEKKEVNVDNETDEFVQSGMKPLTDEQLDQAIGGISN